VGPRIRPEAEGNVKLTYYETFKLEIPGRPLVTVIRLPNGDSYAFRVPGNPNHWRGGTMCVLEDK
jgi:hypothetical protein